MNWLALAVATLSLLSEASAAQRTWTGIGTDGNWSTAANWNTGAPVNNDSVLFTGLTRLTNTNNIANLVLNGIAFTSSGFTLNGTNFLKSNGGAMDTSGNNTNSIVLSLGAAQSFTNNAAPGAPLVFGAAITNNGFGLMIGGSGDVVISGVLGGTNTTSLAASGGLTMNGASTNRLGGANTFAGPLTINSGTVQLGNAAAIPSGPGKGDVTVAPGATLNLSANSQTINGLFGSGTVDNLTGAATYTFTIGNNSTNSGGSFSGTIQNTSGTIAVTKVNTNVRCRVRVGEQPDAECWTQHQRRWH